MSDIIFFVLHVHVQCTSNQGEIVIDFYIVTNNEL